MAFVVGLVSEAGTYLQVDARCDIGRYGSLLHDGDRLVHVPHRYRHVVSDGDVHVPLPAR